MTDLTDTPIAPPTYPPPSRLDQVKALLGDLARPFAIYVVASAVGFAIFRIGLAIADKASSDFTGAAIYITAAGGVLALVFGTKAAENIFASHNAAKVEVAKAQPGATP